MFFDSRVVENTSWCSDVRLCVVVSMQFGESLCICAYTDLSYNDGVYRHFPIETCGFDVDSVFYRFLNPQSLFFVLLIILSY